MEGLEPTLKFNFRSLAHHKAHYPAAQAQNSVLHNLLDHCTALGRENENTCLDNLLCRRFNQETNIVPGLSQGGWGQDLELGHNLFQLHASCQPRCCVQLRSCDKQGLDDRFEIKLPRNSLNKHQSQSVSKLQIFRQNIYQEFQCFGLFFLHCYNAALVPNMPHQK